MINRKNTNNIIHRHKSTIVVFLINVMIAGNTTSANAQSADDYMPDSSEMTVGYDITQSTEYYMPDGTEMTEVYDLGLPYCDELVSDDECMDGTGASACVCQSLQCIKTDAGVGGEAAATGGGAAAPRDCQEIANPLECEACCASNKADALVWCRDRNDFFDYEQCVQNAEADYETAMQVCYDLPPLQTFACVTRARWNKGIMLEACGALWLANQRCVRQAQAEAKACELECNLGIPVDSIITGVKNLCRKLFK